MAKARNEIAIKKKTHNIIDEQAEDTSPEAEKNDSKSLNHVDVALA